MLEKGNPSKNGPRTHPAPPMHRSDHQRAQLWRPLEKIFLAGSDRKKRLNTKMATALGEPKGKGPQAGDAKSPTRLVELHCPVGLKGKAAARAFGPMAPKPGFLCL